MLPVAPAGDVVRDNPRRWMAAAAVVALAALSMGVLRLPQPFLGVLAACLLWSRPAVPARGWLARILAGWCGAGAGAAILVALPQQPAVSLPLFALALGIGYRIAREHSDGGGAMLFSMGMAASFPAGIVVAPDGLVAAMTHGSALSIGAVAVAVVHAGFRFVDPPAEARQPLPAGTLWAVPMAAVASVTISASIFPAGMTVMTVASAVSADAFSFVSGRGAVAQRLAGAVVGSICGVAVLMAVSGSTNDPAVYLGLIAAGAGIAESLANRRPGLAAACRQAAAAFVVVATAFPRPAITIDAALERGAAVFGGVVLGALAVAIVRIAGAGAPTQSE